MQEIDVHRGGRLLIARNLAKQFDFVTGTMGSVLDVFVHVVFVKPTIPTDEGSCAPLIPGHAMTIATSMGPSVPHVTLSCEGS